MDTIKIEKLLKKKLDLNNIFIKKNDKNIEIIAVGDFFVNLTLVKRQQAIYKPLMNYFINQKIHAISIETYTKKEWSKKIKKYIKIKN